MFIVTVVSSLAFVSSPPLSLVQRVIMLARQFCGYDYANMLTLCVCVSAHCIKENVLPCLRLFCRMRADYESAAENSSKHVLALNI